MQFSLLFAFRTCSDITEVHIRERVWTVMGAEQNDGSERNT